MNGYAKAVAIAATILLVAMAGLHGSGLGYFSQLARDSDLPDFIKRVFPTLFAHPSIHLAGLAAFGLLALSLKEQARKVFYLLCFLVALDAAAAIYLGAWLPAGLLALSAVGMAVAGSAAGSSGQAAGESRP